MSALSDSQLIRRLNELVHKERETTLEVIRHIIEFDRRKLYLGVGHSSLFDYCTLQLGYSGSAAQRRIKTARCIREFPEIYAMLERNEIGLSGVCMLADILTPENKSELLKEARCKSKRQIEQIVARFRPGRDIIDKVKPVFVSALIDHPANTRGSENRSSENTKAQDSCSVQGAFSRKYSEKSTAAGGSRSSAVCSGIPQQTPILKKKFKLEFAVEPECMKKIEEAKELLSKKYPEGVPLGTLLEEALDAYLDRHSPRKKKQRREKREAKKESKKNEQQPGNHKNNKRSRHIPQAVQDEVYAKDNGRCTYVGPDGVRCNSTWNLEIDHIIPYARGGDHSIENLRLLCAKHNQLAAEKTYGREYMERRRCGTRPIRE